MFFVISSQSSKIRLDKFLTQKLPNFSRSWIQKLIKEELVLVNQKRVVPHYILKQGDKIKIFPKKPEPIDLSPKKGRLDIVFEDKNFLIINKPAGLVVHPSLAHRKSDTLVNLLLAYCPKIRRVGNSYAAKPPMTIRAPSSRPGIVHRLDKDVSGLMIIAKTQEAFEHLKNQFKNHQIKKEYLVLVHGKVKESQGMITFSISRSKKKGFKMVAIKDKPGAIVSGKFKSAETRFEVIKSFPKYTLLKIQTKTGRTHQIRVHLNAIGHSIVGEKIYKPRKMETQNLDRLFLHACTLGFYDLDGKWREFRIDLPIELKQFLKE
jgi:23S rRNA pseudouridine1911/1915/1917 synthase